MPFSPISFPFLPLLLLLSNTSLTLTSFFSCDSFVLKTKEQRAAEKALMDKSPLKTLTLEDFLESERHKLTGTLTPVTPETFAKWKKERLDKKAAEEEARRAKEETGRAMFEKGDWDNSDDESSEDGEEGGNEKGEGGGGWDLEDMRRETERLRAEREEARVGAVDGGRRGGVVLDEVGEEVGRNGGDGDENRDENRGREGNSEAETNGVHEH